MKQLIHKVYKFHILLILYMMYAAVIVYLFIFKCPVRPVSYSSLTMSGFEGFVCQLYVGCPSLFGNACISLHEHL